MEIQLRRSPANSDGTSTSDFTSHLPTVSSKAQLLGQGGAEQRPFVGANCNMDQWRQALVAIQGRQGRPEGAEKRAHPEKLAGELAPLKRNCITRADGIQQGSQPNEFRVSMVPVRVTKDRDQPIQVGRVPRYALCQLMGTRMTRRRMQRRASQIGAVGPDRREMPK